MSNNKGNKNLLSLKGSEEFRKYLVTRNLNPYKVTNGYSPYAGERYFETILSDLSPKNTPDISDSLFENAEKATKTNTYGEIQKLDGGEIIGRNAGPVSMQQEGTGDVSNFSPQRQGNYTISNTNLQLVSQFFIDAASAVNRFTPNGGFADSYFSTDNILTNKANVGKEYPNYSVLNNNIISRANDEGTINKYLPDNGYGATYEFGVIAPEKTNGGNTQYPNSFNQENKIAKEFQTAAAAINRFIPTDGYGAEISLSLGVLTKKSGSATEYPNNFKLDPILIENTQKEIAVNRYTAVGGELNIYTNRVTILPKTTSGSDEYRNSDIFNSQTSLIAKKEAASINKFIPDGGYTYEVSLGLSVINRGEGIKGEYQNSNISDDTIIKNFQQEIAINRYQPIGGMFNIYTTSLNALTKLGSGAQEYPSISSLNNETAQVQQTQSAGANRYIPSEGYIAQAPINSILLPKNSSTSVTEYPNNIKLDPILVENTQKEIAVNRYTATDGNLNVYSNNVSILPKITNGSQEYVNSDLFNLTITQQSQDRAAAINKYIPNDGYNQEFTTFVNTTNDGGVKIEYPGNVNSPLPFSVENQDKAASVNRYIPDVGYNAQYTNNETILAKIESDTNQYPNNLKLNNENVIDAADKIGKNRYYPNAGISYAYVPDSKILEGNYPTKEYPNFIVPDQSLLGSNLVDISALLNGNVNQIVNPQDSYLQQLSTRFLAESFQQRIAREVEIQTIGRVNLQAFSDPFSLSLLVTGQQPLIYKNFRITVPDGIFDQASNLIQRFTGTYIPVSPIEGEYFTTYPERERTKIGGLIQKVLSVFTKPATPTNRSIKFLNNTGSGQRSVLFSNLGFNVYRPKYDSNTTQVGQAIDNFFDALGNPLGIGDNSIGNLYVPFDTEDIQNLSNPLGLDEIGKTFEGTELDSYKFGLKSTSYNDDRDPTGGMSWTQSSTVDLAGKFVGPNAEQGPQSPGYNGNVQDKFNASRTDKISFRDRTLLKRTQDIVNDTPASGAKRLTSVGNAINQVSKVFHDGYKEMTKGSRVRKYVTKNGAEVGQEYGRVFTKDIPYLTYNNLQSTIANESGLETNGNIRKFTNSILDSTYNLNIAPTFGQDSTNIKDGKVKKYMFSIENLAWRNTDEYNTLPDCEKGPNGGRIMWFPPYELKVGQETNSPTFNSTSFLGRPEPIYTYENTKRSGSISWKIIVDHPSVMDIVLKYELNRADGNTATQVVNSFFAGLKKYDIYELARKYNTVSLTSLENLYQSLLQSNQTSDEVKGAVLNASGPQSNLSETSNGLTDLSNNYVGYGFYFPKTYSSVVVNYDTIYDTYMSEENFYISQNGASIPPVQTFFETYLVESKTKIDDLRNKVGQILEGEKEMVEITIQKIKSVGQPDNEGIWITAIENFFGEYTLSNNKKIADYIGKTLTIKTDSGEQIITTPLSSSGGGQEINCGDTYNELLVDYTFYAAACRGYIIKTTTITPNENAPINTDANQESSPTPQANTGLKPQQLINIGSDTTGISKRIIRELLTETNYFEALKSDQSFVYDTIKTKFKFFNPAFHSMTPEGLNSRLVFLNQCVRPGKTIPTKQEDGTSVTTDSFNTNFGTPPILVLRVGDFYHTKIVPTSLSFTYSDIWDMNPEGVGFQPMIVDVSLGYDMIGGHGLAGPVERLQNALSFNYYANTEMYDERAVPTEDTTAIDNALLSSIRNNEPLPIINNAGSVQSDLGKTFGEIVDSTPFSGGVQTGVLQYKTFFNEFIDSTRAYFQETFNVYETTVNQYNRGIWGQLMFKRNFTNGNSLTLQTPVGLNLIGKPVDYQTAIQALAEDYVDNINQDRLYEAINNAKTADTITNSVKNKMVDNFTEYITSIASTNFNSLSTAVQDISDVQLKLTTSMEIMDYISFSGDAKVLNDGSTKFYYLTGQTENGQDSLESFKSDYSKIVEDLSGYTNVTKQLFISEIDDTSAGFYQLQGNIAFQYLDNLAYTLFSEIILDTTKKSSFVESIIKDVNEDFTTTCENIVNEFLDTYWIEIFTAEKDYEKEFIDSTRNGNDYKIYSDYNPQVNGVSVSTKERKMSFATTGNSANYETAYNNIKSSQNSNSDVTTFNGKKQYNG
jgi:hypothetical protein